jgi:hypothetical protein
MAHVTVSSKKESSYEHKEIKKMVLYVYIFFLDSPWVVHKEFVPPGVTVRRRYYLKVMGRLRKRVMRVRMEIVGDWILRAWSRNCSRIHSMSVREFLAKKWISLLPQTPCYPICHLVILLVPKIKIESHRTSFSNTWQRSEGCNRRHQDPKRSWLRILLWGMENSLGQLCSSRGMLFGRGLLI